MRETRDLSSQPIISLLRRVKKIEIHQKKNSKKMLNQKITETYSM